MSTSKSGLTGISDNTGEEEVGRRDEQRITEIEARQNGLGNLLRLGSEKKGFYDLWRTTRNTPETSLHSAFENAEERSSGFL